MPGCDKLERIKDIVKYSSGKSLKKTLKYVIDYVPIIETTLIGCYSEETSQANGEEKEILTEERETSASIGEYKIVREIGQGRFSSVYLVSRNNMKYALKKLRGNMLDVAKERFFKEALKVDALRREHNIEYIVAIEDVLMENNAYVMEYLEEGSQEYINRTKDYDYFIRLIQGVNDLHSFGIAHRDIRPETIRTRNNLPVITDFGIASWKDADSAYHEGGGTLLFAPPEAVYLHGNHLAARRAFADLKNICGDTDKEKSKNVKKLHDVYSLGVTVGVLLTDKFPFTNDEFSEYLDKGSLVSLEAWFKDIPYKFREFVERAMTFYPLERPFLNEILIAD